MPNRRILLIDTCGVNATIALAEFEANASRILASETLPNRSASERLLPAIQSLTAAGKGTAEGIALASLAAIAVVHGPGSFTGVRIGVAATKGLSEALNLPVLAISRLAVLASKSPAAESIPLLDAGRRELYAGHYLDGVCLTEDLLTLEETLTLASTHPQATLLTCEPAVAALLAPISITLIPELTAADALPLALTRLAAQAFDDISTLDANYVRRTPAQIFAKPTKPVTT